MSNRSARDRAAFYVLTIVPIVLGGGATVANGWAAGDSVNSVWLRPLAIVLGVVAVMLLIVKAGLDRKTVRSLDEARYAAIRELHNRLGPALDQMSELALIDPIDSASRHFVLKNVADQCCSAIASMTRGSRDVRAVVFELRAATSEIAPLGRFGRSEMPRTFSLAQSEGAEVESYLSNPASRGVLYKDVMANAPIGYRGAPDRYRTFIRVPIRTEGSGAVFGMLTIDAPKEGSLTEGDVYLANLIAAEMAAAFAITAG